MIYWPLAIIRDFVSIKKRVSVLNDILTPAFNFTLSGKVIISLCYCSPSPSGSDSGSVSVSGVSTGRSGAVEGNEGTTEGSAVCSI